MKARQSSPELADAYLRHMSVGDPLADAAVEGLTRCKAAHRLIQAGMDRDEKAFAEAPAELREFFEQIETPPDWWSPESVHAGRRAFHANSDLFIPAFFVVTTTAGSCPCASASCMPKSDGSCAATASGTRRSSARP